MNNGQEVKMKKKLIFYIVIFHLGCNAALAEEFNYSFIRGGSKDIPDILDSNKKTYQENMWLTLFLTVQK